MDVFVSHSLVYLSDSSPTVLWGPGQTVFMSQMHPVIVMGPFVFLIVRSFKHWISAQLSLWGQ